MIGYFIFFLTLLLVPVFKKKSYINFIYFSLFYSFFSFRNNVGWDFKFYFELAEQTWLLKYPLFFDKIENFNFFIFQYWRMELLNKIFYKITWFFNHPQIIFFLYGFVIIFSLKKGLDYYNKYSIYPWITFLSFPMFFFSFFSIMRQACAIMLIFFSYRYIYKRKIIKFIILVFIASLFHDSAKYCFPIYFLNRHNFSKKFLSIIFFFSFFSEKIFLFFLKTSLFSKYSGYVENRIGSGGKLIYYFVIGIVILVICCSDKLKKNRENIFFINTIVMGGCIYISLISFGDLGPRMSIYFLIFFIYLVEDILVIFKQKIIVKGIYILLSLGLVVSSLYVDYRNPVRSQYIPYKIFFMK
jgi:hypothetical protein